MNPPRSVRGVTLSGCPRNWSHRGAAARRVVDEALPSSGAVLLRGLPMRSGESFGHFWAACLREAPALEEGEYTSLGGNRRERVEVRRGKVAAPLFPLFSSAPAASAAALPMS